MRILTVNAGSSSLKVRVVEADDRCSTVVDLDAEEGRVGDDVLASLLDEVGTVDAVAHRVVHGGPHVTAPVVADDEVVSRLTELVPLAPLHQPAALHAIAATRAAWPSIPNVVCVDTAFHADLPVAAHTYAVPAAWRQRWGVRRYGFHGLSHAWATRRSAALAGRSGDPDWRFVSCHLGAGASLAAVRGGRSIDTTMGFTPLEGLVMARRAGSIDPGIPLWLMESAGLDRAEVFDGLERHSGLMGLAGTADMREVLRRAGSGDDDAALAVDVYVHALCRHVGAMAASLGGLDAIAFTGGVGERAAEIRRRVAERVAWLGVTIDPVANEGAESDAEISADGSTVATFVIASREELEMANGARSVLA